MMTAWLRSLDEEKQTWNSDLTQPTYLLVKKHVYTVSIDAFYQKLEEANFTKAYTRPH